VVFGAEEQKWIKEKGELPIFRQFALSAIPIGYS
jgi:hypothetical protein